MAIAYRNSTTVTSTAASATGTPPAGLANDDIILILLYKENTAAVTFPAGFTQLIAQSGTGFAIYAAWKRAASESGNYVPTWTGSIYHDIIVAAYSGCIATGSPIDVTSVSTSGTGTQINCPTLTTVTNGAMVVAFGADIVGDTVSNDANYTTRQTFDDTKYADRLQTTAGVVPAGAFAVNLSGAVAGLSVALTPAGAATPSNIILPQLRLPQSFFAR